MAGGLAVAAIGAPEVIATLSVGGVVAGAGVEVIATGVRTGLTRLTAATLATLPELSTVAGQAALAASEVSFATANGAVQAGAAASDAGSFATVASRASTASVAGGTPGAQGAIAGGAAGARAGQIAVEQGSKAVAIAGKVAGGVCGGIAIVAGGVEMGLAIETLCNGSTTWHHIVELRDNLRHATQNCTWPNEHQRSVVFKSLQDVEALEVDVKEYDITINSTKTGAGAVGIAGGALTIGGFVCPPLLIPGLIMGGVGAATSITTTVIDLCVVHKDRYMAICNDLHKGGIFVTTMQEP